MLRMGTSTSAPARTIFAALLALLLGARLLAPAGFMPAFDRGAVTIVVCPDGDGGIAAAHHHHSGDKHFHQQCPFAAASSVGAVAGPAVLLIAVPLFAAALAPRLTPAFMEQRQSNRRPPPTGPPFRN
jgi:hypothetical protein